MSKQPNETLLEKTNIFSFLIFGYMIKVLKRGWKKVVMREDLYKMNPNFEFENHLKQFQDYRNQKSAKGWSMLRILCFWVIPIWWILVFGFTMNNVLNIANPYLLEEFIDWFYNKSEGNNKGIIILVIIGVLNIIKPFFGQHGMRAAAQVMISIQCIFFGLYSEKLQKLKMSARNYVDFGMIQNSVSNDILRLVMLNFTAHQIILTPILVVVYTILIGIYIKWVTLIGLALIIAATIIQILLGNVLNDILKRKFFLQDQRSKQMQTTLSGIKQIKLNAWEKIIINVLEQIRNKEKSIILNYVLIRALIDGLLFMIPMLCSVVTIVVYQKYYDQLSLGRSFFIIQMYNLCTQPIRVFFFAIVQLVSAKVGIDRIQFTMGYPDEEEQDLPTYNVATLYTGEIQFDQVSAGYNNENLKLKNESFQKKKDLEQYVNKNVIQDISFKVQQGEFVAIIGKVGCGKSSLINSIMGQLFINKGQIIKNGKIGYIPQNPFLMHESLKNNILFGQDYNKEKYKEILKLCELNPDINILPDKDQTEIGERGINLSGGQKQRVSIARILYANPDIYLIDDALSALDAHVGKKIFHNILCGKLAGKTRFMTTHALQYLEMVDKIIFMEDGQIIDQGTYDNLFSQNEKFRQFINKQQEEEKKQEQSILDSEVDQSFIDQSNNELSESLISQRKSGVQQLAIQEKRFTGQVGFKLYYQYFKKASISYFLFSLFLIAISVGLRIFIDYFIGSWIQDEYGLAYNTYVKILFILAAATLVFIFLRGITIGHVLAIINVKVFKEFMSKLLKKNMNFFDSTPSGQIQNLVTKDTDYMDVYLSGQFYQFFALLFQLIGTFIIVSIGNWLVIPVIIFCLIVLSFIVNLYLKTSMELRRLEQLTYSPILTNISEFYHGLPLYRSLNQIEFIRNIYVEKVNELNSIMYHDRLASIFTNLMTEILVGIMILATTLFFTLGRIYNWNFLTKDSGLVSVTLNWILVLPLSINFFMFNFTDIQKGMSAIQRIFNNINDGQEEASFETPLPPQNWPEKGSIKAKNVDIRYRENLPLVLKGVNFEIHQGERIGVVGRTGSGKSTLLNALTRILELDNPNEASIIIDDVDIKSIGLTPLRSNIQVIPQEPFLLEGTIRLNIDPMNKLSDEQVIECLKQTLIWDSVLFQQQDSTKTQDNISNQENQEETKKLLKENEEKVIMTTEENKLNFQITQKGDNLSNGQKQLICLARAFGTSPKILFMDEATSNIDPETDKKIQKLFQTHFENSTIITIAHRLDTIIFYDRIFIFDEGQLVDQGSPYELLKRKSMFNDLVKENGEEFRTQMVQIAKEIYEKKQNFYDFAKKDKAFKG